MLVLPILITLFNLRHVSSEDKMVFSIDYFKQRNVPFICVISCKDQSAWNTNFMKQASNLSMAVTSFRADEDSWHHRYEVCMAQRFTYIGVLMMADCEYAAEIFYIASENLWLDFRHVWLIVEDNSTEELDNGTVTNVNENRIIIELDNMNISVDADIVMAFKTGSFQYQLYDIFNFGKVQGGDLKVVNTGTWDLDSGLKANLSGYKYYRRWNFGQWKMRLVSVIASPTKKFDVKMLTELRPVPRVSIITRTSTIIMITVGEVHNITFVHKLTSQWFGAFQKNSTRVVSNSLYFHEQDVTTVLRFLKVFYEKIGIIHPSLTSLETKYYYRIPTTGPGRYENQFLRPLSEGTWWTMIGICIICIIILMMAAMYERRPSSAQYAFFSVTASVCQQFFEDDFPAKTTSGARKLTVFITGLFCVLIYNYYTSSVVSWLLNGPPPSLNSLQELIESSLDIVLEDTGYALSWLNNPDYYFNKRYTKEEDKLKQKVKFKKDGKPETSNVVEGIAMVKAGGYAFHTETDNANRLISKTFTQGELCEVGSLPSMEKTLLYPAVQKNSPYKEFLTWSLTRLLERGIVSCIQRRTLAPPISCEASMPRALALGGAAPAFILLAMGFMLATGIMVGERFLYKMQLEKLNAF